MANKLTADQLEQVRYRKLLLDDRIQALTELIDGRGTVFKDFINDEDGKPSNEKTDALIAELIDCLNRRRVLEKRRKLSRNAAEMYKALLYLAIFGVIYKENRRIPGAGYIAPTESFADIIQFAESLETDGFEEHRDLLMYDLQRYIEQNNITCCGKAKPLSGSFGLLTLVMHENLQHFCIYTLSKSDLTKLCKEYAKRFGFSESETQELIDNVTRRIYSPEEEYDLWDRQDEEQWEALMKQNREDYERDLREGKFSGSFEEYMQEIEEAEMGAWSDEEIAAHESFDDDITTAVSSLGENESFDDSEALRGLSVEKIKDRVRAKSSWDKWDQRCSWSEELTDPKRYCECFDAFAHLFFKTDRTMIVRDVTDMVDTFLFEHKMSAFSFGDDYLMINYYFDQLKKRVMSEIRRGRGK